MRELDRWQRHLAALIGLFLGLTAALQASGDPWSDGLSGDAVELVQIFNNGFESGDTSAWSDTTANLCPAPTGGPTLHANAVASNQTWSANGSPHILTTNVTVPPGVTLVIAPCAELRIRPGVNLTVQGTLVAPGTPFRRITIHRDDPLLPFAYLWVRSPGFANLAYVDLTGGGSSDASLLIEGTDSPETLPAKLNHVKVTGSASYGVHLFRNAGFAAGSRDLVVSGSGATLPASPFPVRMGLPAVGTLPTGSYTGNASDVVQLIIGAVQQTDVTFHNREVPYQLGGGGSAGLLLVDGNAGLATMTVDAGTELRFYSQGSNIGGLFIGANGRLVAAGTAPAPILFTGLGVGGNPPAAGSWEGITFFSDVDPGTVLDHVQIDAAGAHGGDQGYGCPPAADGNQTDGALKIFLQPTSEFLTNSTISNSSTHGVFRAWTGEPVDFLATNSFSNVAFCQQVLPHPTPPANCPVDPACPH